MTGRKVLTVEEALKKAAYFCAYQERCHKEVEEKLKALGMFDTAIDHIMHRLLQDNNINEERFARSFARGKNQIKGWGKRRIEQELKQRQLSSYTIACAFKEIEPTYWDTFDALTQKKWDQLHHETLWVKKKKFTDYFLRKGYEYHNIVDRSNELEKSS